MTKEHESGRPVRETLLPYGQQWLDEQDIEAVVKVLRGAFITQGPAIEQFERKVADAVGAKYAVAFANGTAALHGACFAAEIGQGDEVITTPITFWLAATVSFTKGARRFLRISTWIPTMSLLQRLSRRSPKDQSDHRG